MSFIRRPYGWAKVYAVLLTLAFGFCLLDAFVIPKSYAAMETPSAGGSAADERSAETAISNSLFEDGTESAPTPRETAGADAVGESESDKNAAVIEAAEPEVSANSYSDENIQITVETVVEYDTTLYVADIRISDPRYLKTALAQNTYGRNLKATTSEMAAEHSAILAINGDYYGFRDTGYVLRNGVLYRNTGNGDALVIDHGGNFSIVEQRNITEEVVAGAWHILSFGPALVEDGAAVVDATTEVTGKSSSSNPRTAIGQIAEGHYIIIVSDGRTGTDAGLSLEQLAVEFAERGAITAYNLDGGGSSTLVLNGTVINTTVSCRSGGERKVSDIVYIGYE